MSDEIPEWAREKAKMLFPWFPDGHPALERVARALSSAEQRTLGDVLKFLNAGAYTEEELPGVRRAIADVADWLNELRGPNHG